MRSSVPGRVGAIAAAIALAACAHRAHAPPPELPPPPAPLTDAPISMESTEQATDPTASLRPKPEGDREIDALRISLWGCQVMGIRLQPSMSGLALLRVRVGAGGEVVRVVPEAVQGLTPAVVDCLVRHVAAAHFDPRRAGTEFAIPVDFTNPARSDPASRPPVPTMSL